MVRGITVLDNVMYVVFATSPTIHLYNANTHILLDFIKVNAMKPLDIVVCRDDRQLYVAELRCIWRVSVDDQSCTKWLTTQTLHCNSLSLMSRRLLMMSSSMPSSLRLYNTTDRQLLRVVKLPRCIGLLHHGIETTRGTFVVGYWDMPEELDKWHSAVSELFCFVNNQRCLQPVSMSRVTR